MRWPTLRPRADDPSLVATASRLEEFAARQEPLGSLQRDRIRSATLAAFARQPATASRSVTTWRLPRGAAVALALAAVLALAGTVAAAESGPGEPFYGLRLGIESLTLPSEGSARTQALLAQLDRRLAEARDENAKGNANGVADAVRAYTATLNEIGHGIGPGVSQAAVDAALQRHLTVLNNLLGSAPAAAAPGLQQALDHTQQALEHRPAAPGSNNQPSHPGPPQSPPGKP